MKVLDWTNADLALQCGRSSEATEMRTIRRERRDMATLQCGRSSEATEIACHCEHCRRAFKASMWP